ncbi:FUSC family protein, partial [Clostridium sp.]|uniref:FUSC family protein n=1 Tax=Clostridium sp. TaxID=1506 RepID=UPI003F307CAD
LGSILIVILFDIFKDTTIRTLIIMLAGYIGSYISEYKYNMILVTVSAIGSVALMSDYASVLSIERVVFVALGLIISLIINRYLCTYKIEDSNNDLIKLYDDLIEKMIIEVQNSLKDVRNENVVRNLFIRSSLIEEKISVNNQASINPKSEISLENRRLLTNSVYRLYIRILKQKDYKDSLNIITDSLKDSLKNKGKNLTEIIEGTKGKIKNIESVNDKLMILSLLEIICEIDYLDKQKINC